MNELSSISLEFREGTSDKVYKAAIEDAGNGLYVVNFAFGRRGGTLNTGTKTTQPVPYDEAKKAYDKIVKEKVGKGYKPVGGGEGLGTSVTASVANAVTDRDQRDTGLYPQLLVAISEDEAERYVTDDDWAAQEKFDGKRMTVRKDGNVTYAANKKGLSIGFPDAIAASISHFMSSFVADGEAIGDRLFAFDLLELNGVDLRPMRYSDRLKYLNEMLLKAGKAVAVAKTAIGTAAKRKLMAELKAAGKEGIVFKRLSAPWSAGRPESGGPAIKCKFWSSCSCVVTGVNAKRSVNVGLFDGTQASLAVGESKPIGKVTIPPNHVVPVIEQVIEVKYLYVVGKGGSLYQPIYLGPRDDVDASECTFDQQKLKYKADSED